MAVSTTTAASIVFPVVLTMHVWPEISSPGAWPVCKVVMPKLRTQVMSLS